MKILYNASTDTRKYYPITGGGHQQVLLQVELDNDWFVFVSDDTSSKIYLMRVINKFERNVDKFYHSFNMEVVDNEEQFNYLYKWFDNNFNYQDRHKDDAIDNG